MHSDLSILFFFFDVIKRAVSDQPNWFHESVLESNAENTALALPNFPTKQKAVCT